MQNEATARLQCIRHWHENRSIKAKEKFFRFYYFVEQKKIPSSAATECQIQREVPFFGPTCKTMNSLNPSTVIPRLKTPRTVGNLGSSLSFVYENRQTISFE